MARFVLHVDDMFQVLANRNQGRHEGVFFFFSSSFSSLIYLLLSCFSFPFLSCMTFSYSSFFLFISFFFSLFSFLLLPFSSSFLSCFFFISLLFFPSFISIVPFYLHTNRHLSKIMIIQQNKMENN